MNENEEKILVLKSRIAAYKDQLILLCDIDYYNCCDMIDQLERELKELEQGKDEKNIIEN